MISKTAGAATWKGCPVESRKSGATGALFWLVGFGAASYPETPMTRARYGH
jgi:hypothetical protein